MVQQYIMYAEKSIEMTTNRNWLRQTQTTMAEAHTEINE